MPLFDLECCSCGHIFEYLFIRSDDYAHCPECDGGTFNKLFTMLPHARMDSDSILKSLPDPTPPLEELRGCREGALADKPYASSNLRDYVRKKDKHGNNIWIEKDRSEKKTIFFT